MNYKYSQSWFLISEIKKLLLGFIDGARENRILEIGCFEGLSSVFFADNLLDHPKSRLTCVDPFLNDTNNDHKDYLANNHAENNFDHNIKACKNSDKILIKKITSDLFFTNNTDTYNFIYIDGCHTPDFIYRDMTNSFNALEQHGIMWMDDYGGGQNGNIKNTMNEFLKEHQDKHIVIHSGYQLAIKKV